MNQKMRHTTLSILSMLLVNTSVYSQSLTLETVRHYENQVADVTEITDTTYLKQKLMQVESQAQHRSDNLTQTRLGILYHEVALTLSFLSKDNPTHKGYAQKSFDLLNELVVHTNTPPELMPIVCAYRASALSLVSAETKKLSLLGKAFALFDQAVNQYAMVSSAPEFLRGSVAENLPWFFISKRKAAQHDFASIIEKQRRNPAYADAKTMSFTYWAWARQHQGKKYRQQSLAYLELAIQLDPTYQAGRQRAETLKKKLTSPH